MSNSTPTSLNPEERDLERRLRGLAPGTHGIDRDTLMFRAGQRHAGRQAYRWQVLTMVLAVCAGVLAITRLGPRSGGSDLNLAANDSNPASHGTLSTPGDMLAVAPETWTPPRWPIQARSQLLELQDRVMARGLDALPEPIYVKPSSDLPASVREWLLESRARPDLDLTTLPEEHLNPGDPS